MTVARRARLLLLVATLATTAARAGCGVAADAGGDAGARTIDPANAADADLVISMSMVPKLTHLDYEAAGRRPACDLGPLVAGEDAYELWGDDDAGRQRKALPAGKGKPVAILIPIFDLMKALGGAKAGKPATTEGYLLATVTKTELTGWRFYTAVPELAVLRHDMTRALAGTGSPIFRNGADGKTHIFLARQ